MAYVTKTLNAAATTGYVVALGQKCGKVTVETVGAAAIRVFGGGDAPAQPTSAYVPNAGETKDSVNLPANGNVSFGVDYEGRGFVPGLQEPIEYVAVWAVDGGHVRIVGH